MVVLPNLMRSNRTTRAIVLALGVAVFLASMSALVLTHPEAWRLPPGRNRRPHGPFKTPRPSLPPLPQNHTTELAMQYMEHIMKPSVKVDNHQYSPFGAFGWGLPSTIKWKKPLGEDLCIIDLDNREFNKPGQIWADQPMSWNRPQEVHGLSAGVLNHWLYAKIHGYKYYFIDIEEFEDRRNSWKKPPVISEILRNHKVCIYIDSDAIFSHLDLPFEWLMNYWSLDPKTNSLALAVDPDLNHNKDKYGKLYLNTGFIIAQNNDRTFEIMDAWEDCPEENGAHPDCVKFRKAYPGQPTDQGGFGTYIRYDYPRDIKELPCNEANGYPQSGVGCKGDFIKHLWTGKDDWIKIAVGEQMPGELLETFHRQFLEEKPYFWMTEKELMLYALGKR